MNINDTINHILQVERLCNKNNKKIEMKIIVKRRPTNLWIVEQICKLKLSNSEAVETVFLIWSTQRFFSEKEYIEYKIHHNTA